MIFLFYLSTAVVTCSLMKFNSQNSSEHIYKALALFYAPRLMTGLIGEVRGSFKLESPALSHLVIDNLIYDTYNLLKNHF